MPKMYRVLERTEDGLDEIIRAVLPTEPEPQLLILEYGPDAYVEEHWVMSDEENLFLELSIKAFYEPLNDEEQEGLERIQGILGLTPCPQCEGEGGWTVPSMYAGWEWGACTLCEGLGELGFTPPLKEELKRVYNPQPEDPMGEFWGRNF